MSIKIVSIVGARPQFVKAAVVSREIRAMAGMHEVMIHTGQHFDHNMSQVFFDELDIPKPDYNLNISGCSHGKMTAQMLMAIETILIDEKPSLVLIYGDTNSTLAGALAATKLHIPIAHVEAGLRSFNMRMPEEINRILSDRVSNLHFCTSDLAVANLKNEGLTKSVHNVGDVMYDAALFYSQEKFKKTSSLESMNLEAGQYVLATCHRAENTNEKENLENILAGLYEISQTLQVVFPIHPRTCNFIAEHNLSHYLNKLTVVDPLPYIDMLWLEKNAKVIITDSGGVQKEAYFFNVPCVTIREETEWLETVSIGANRLAGASREKIVEYTLAASVGSWSHMELYGDGKAGRKIVDVIMGLVN